MRKRLVTPIPQAGTPHDDSRLDLDREAMVEVTSEDKDCPVEAALVLGETRGWRAAVSGAQTVRLIFDKPAKTRAHRARLRRNRHRAYPRVRLAMVWGIAGIHFERLCASNGISSPPNSILEVEEYRVELSDVTFFELIIVPDISREPARASLKSLRLSLTRYLLKTLERIAEENLLSALGLLLFLYLASFTKSGNKVRSANDGATIPRLLLGGSDRLH